MYQDVLKALKEAGRGEVCYHHALLHRLCQLLTYNITVESPRRRSGQLEAPPDGRQGG